MGGIYFDIYLSLYMRLVLSRSGYCVDMLFRMNSELLLLIKDLYFF